MVALLKPQAHPQARKVGSAHRYMKDRIWGTQGLYHHLLTLMCGRVVVGTGDPEIHRRLRRS